MKKIRIVVMLAFFAIGCGDVAALAQSSLPPVSHSIEPSQSVVAVQIRALLSKNPHGGKALTAAIANLLERDPGAIADVISVATFNADKEQALAIELGVVQAQAFLKTGSPASASYILSFLVANKTNNVVAQILGAEQSEGSVYAANQGNGQGGNSQGGNGGGGSGNGNGGCGNGNGQGAGHGAGNLVSCH